MQDEEPWREREREQRPGRTERRHRERARPCGADENKREKREKAREGVSAEATGMEGSQAPCASMRGRRIDGRAAEATPGGVGMFARERVIESVRAI